MRNSQESFYIMVRQETDQGVGSGGRHALRCLRLWEEVCILEPLGNLCWKVSYSFIFLLLSQDLGKCHTSRSLP